MSTPAAIVDALDYVRSRSQVDVDSLDVQGKSNSTVGERFCRIADKI